MRVPTRVGRRVSGSPTAITVCALNVSPKPPLANLKRDCYCLLSSPIPLSKPLYLGLTGAMDVVLLCEFKFSRGDELATEFGRILFNRP